MSYTSPRGSAEFVIDDSTNIEDVTDPTKGTGLELERRTTPYGQMYGAPPFPQHLLIDTSEFQARIEEKDRLGNRISDWIKRSGSKCKDQGQTNYCWINSPTRLLEILRMQQNLPHVELSPASVGGPIKGYRNQGGFGEEGLEYLIRNGSVPVSMWPANAIDRRYDTAEATAARAMYKVGNEWFELQPRNHQEMISCLLRNIVVTVGLNWWRHQVTYCDAVWQDGQAVIRFENSHGSGFGDQGMAILQGQKMYADDCVAAYWPVAA